MRQTVGYQAVARSLAVASLGLCLTLHPSGTQAATAPAADASDITATAPATDASVVSAPIAEREPALTGRFSGDYKDSSARDVLMDIARAARMNVVLPSDLEGNITAHFENLPLGKALSMVAGMANADYRVAEGSIMVVKRAVVVRASAASPTASGLYGDMSERDVERIARQMDEESSPRVRPRRAQGVADTAPVRVETYINIQSPRPSYPSFPAYSGWSGWSGWSAGFPVGIPAFAPLGGVYQFRWNNTFPNQPFARMGPNITSWGPFAF